MKWSVMLLGTSLGVAGSGNFWVAQAIETQPKLIAQASSGMSNLSGGQLINTEWLLKYLGGTGVVDRVQTTLRFDSTTRVSGTGGCNRYSAQAQLGNLDAPSTTEIRFAVGAVTSTRMMCAPAISDQENRFFQALQASRRVQFEGESLLVYSEGIEAPLRFARLMPDANNSADRTLTFFERPRNAVRVFTRDGRTLMNVYNRRDRSIWIREIEVSIEQTAEGTRYRNMAGEAAVEVLVPRSGEPTLTINGQVDR